MFKLFSSHYSSSRRKQNSKLSSSLSPNFAVSCKTAHLALPSIPPRPGITKTDTPTRCPRSLGEKVRRHLPRTMTQR